MKDELDIRHWRGRSRPDPGVNYRQSSRRSACIAFALSDAPIGRGLQTNRFRSLYLQPRSRPFPPQRASYQRTLQRTERDGRARANRKARLKLDGQLAVKYKYRAYASEAAREVIGIIFDNGMHPESQ